MDQRGQISIEYVLLVSIVLIVVVIFGLIITDQSEQNNVASAVQLGASNASANLVFANNSQSPVKVTNVAMTNTGQNINVVVHFSRSVADQQATIIASIVQSLKSSGYTNVSYTTSSATLTTSTNALGTRHIYNITLS
ncbi:MAG: class III signal peptide-containing protein [Methanobacterium sp. ERen5]|nr:MAG: class III signal peptide-containing protein [Methanobacterium sp. ERen5]